MLNVKIWYKPILHTSLILFNSSCDSTRRKRGVDFGYQQCRALLMSKRFTRGWCRQMHKYQLFAYLLLRICNTDWHSFESGRHSPRHELNWARLSLKYNYPFNVALFIFRLYIWLYTIWFGSTHNLTTLIYNTKSPIKLSKLFLVDLMH